MCSSTSHHLSTRTGARINRLDQSWLANSNVHKAGGRIEEGYIRNSGDRPLVAYIARTDIDFHQRAVVTSDIEATSLVIDIEPVRSS